MTPLLLRHVFGLGLVASLTLLSGWVDSVEAQSETCTVAYVLDGDTLNCSNGERIRLLLVDSPERGPFGTLARNALAALLPSGSEIRLELDQESRDERGRLLAYVFLADGRMVNEMLIRQGYAFLKPSVVNRRHGARLRAAESTARQQRLGVWTR
jgi:micrococcal nuclease